MSFKAFSKLARAWAILLLLQIYAAEAVLSFGAGWVVAQGCLERRFGLIVITPLKECGTERQIVPAELISVGVAGEGKRLSEPLFGGLRDAFEISLDVLRVDRSLIDLNDVALSVDQKEVGRVRSRWRSKR